MDRRRVNGPEISATPLPLPDAAKGTSVYPRVHDLASLQSSLASLSASRSDNRSSTDPRPLFLKTGLVANASGSAYLEQGHTRVACAVHGPRPIKRGSALFSFSSSAILTCDFVFAPFALPQRMKTSGPAGTRSNEEMAVMQEYSLIINEALSPAIRLHLYPKSAIDVAVTVLECDGMHAALAAAVTCASAALADAGIEMIDIVTAASGVFAATSQQLARQSKDSKTSSGGQVFVALMPNLNQIAHVVTEGEISPDSLRDSIDTLVDTCIKGQAAVQHWLTKAADLA
ncbi:ribosomal protein S5 domain 2-like protein [Ramicandelaber brevisporus]|nr:ribosomal protein S5 domain 2-like protein [Ramicandelaber brevisporus]